MSDQWMGSVAAQDQYRELGNDPWTNTMRGTQPAPGQGFAPASPVLYNTKAGPITEEDVSGAIGIGMGVSGGGLKTDIVKAPGIKAYHSSPHDFDKFDLGSRGAGSGSSNFVVFDPSIVDIMKKYGIAGAAPVGMGALAAQDAYQPEERM